WMGMGAMMPFARGHYGFSSLDREPWSYGSATENTSRLALNRRYRLLNYFYTQFYESHTTGLPVSRPLFFAEPANPDLREYDDGFLVGPGLLVVGATKPGAVPQVPPMQTPIYRFGFPQSDAPGAPSDLNDSDLPDLYVLGGHIVTANELVQHSRELTPRRDEAIEVIIGLDENGEASGTFYEDTGDGWDFQTGGYSLVEFGAQLQNGQLTVVIDSTQGNLPLLDRAVSIRLLQGGGNETTFATTTSQLPVTFAAATPTPDTQPSPALRDGRLIRDNYAAGPLATNDRDRYSEISQLRALYARPVDGGLEIGIEGELAIDGTAVAVFIDADTGGQTFINTSSLNPPPAGLSALTGTVMETGFTPERLLFANGFEGSVFCDWVTLDAGGNGSKTYLGRQFIGSGGSTLTEGNNLGIEVALGSAGHAARSGFEIFIPESQLGSGTGQLGQVKVFAAIVKTSGQITNQTLPEATNVWPGFTPNFPAVPGQQYASVLLDPDLTGDGAIDFRDAIEALRRIDAGDPSLDLALPLGVLDSADAAEYIRGTFVSP
ncbi:MAG: TIM-barrel domain-containing protein, partial [Planctomycetota bacterium]